MRYFLYGMSTLLYRGEDKCSTVLAVLMKVGNESRKISDKFTMLDSCSPLTTCGDKLCSNN
ncbi:MAG: hypothetical protein AB1638_04560 [Nitrospirota bacterium]